jgi:small subunit ribosomal protein S17
MATEKNSTAGRKAKGESTAERKSAPRNEAPAVEASAHPKQTDLRNPLQKRKMVVGTVVSDKMMKTIVVKVDRKVREPLYPKYVTKSERYKAHDEKNEAKVGDRVSLVASRPVSRGKRWVLQSILRKAGQTQDANV